MMNNITNDQPFREHLVNLLYSGGAHATLDDVLRGVPEDLRGKSVSGINRSIWQILEHLRICQKDILDYMVLDNYKEMKFPDEYWPHDPMPPSADAWDNCIQQFKADLKEIENITRDPSIDLYAKVPTGDHTLLREILLVADHNAYHIGQIIFLRQLLGIDSDGWI